MIVQITITVKYLSAHFISIQGEKSNSDGVRNKTHTRPYNCEGGIFVMRGGGERLYSPQISCMAVVTLRLLNVVFLLRLCIHLATISLHLAGKCPRGFPRDPLPTLTSLPKLPPPLVLLYKCGITVSTLYTVLYVIYEFSSQQLHSCYFFSILQASRMASMKRNVSVMSILRCFEIERF